MPSKRRLVTEMEIDFATIDWQEFLQRAAGWDIASEIRCEPFYTLDHTFLARCAFADSTLPSSVIVKASDDQRWMELRFGSRRPRRAA